MPMTTEAESAEVMKKIARTMIATKGSHSTKGRLSMRAEKTSGASMLSVNPAAPDRYIEIEVPPMMPCATKSSGEGVKIVRRLNWRMERAREMRARKVPTNGHEAIHRAEEYTCDT